MNGLVAGVFEQNTDRQHQDNHEQRRQQSGEGFLYRRWHAFGHFDNQFAALEVAEQFGPQQ
ncbi:hypothetical protein D3C80_2198560 [compost metagenome]